MGRIIIFYSVIRGYDANKCFQIGKSLLFYMIFFFADIGKSLTFAIEIII